MESIFSQGFLMHSFIHKKKKKWKYFAIHYLLFDESWFRPIRKEKISLSYKKKKNWLSATENIWLSHIAYMFFIEQHCFSFSLHFNMISTVDPLAHPLILHLWVWTNDHVMEAIWHVILFWMRHSLSSLKGKEYVPHNSK